MFKFTAHVKRHLVSKSEFYVLPPLPCPRLNELEHAYGEHFSPVTKISNFRLEKVVK